MNCEICGADFIRDNAKSIPLRFCSYSCYEKHLKTSKKPNSICQVCGIEFYRKQSNKNRLKHSGITCSKECSSLYRSEYFKGKGNHQFGIKGCKNNSFSNKDRITNCGYILEYCPNHPSVKKNDNYNGRVRQHRLVVERNHTLFDKKFFEEKDGWIVLKDEYDVHHKDGNKKNNNVDNLQVLTRGEHTRLHNLEYCINRDDLGRIIGVSKLP